MPFLLQFAALLGPGLQLLRHHSAAPCLLVVAPPANQRLHLRFLVLQQTSFIIESKWFMEGINHNFHPSTLRISRK